MSATAVRAYVGLGANLGDARAALRAAWQRLCTVPGCSDAGLSAFYRSAPVDAAGPDFINAVGALDTTLDPLALLDAMQALELAFGRERPYRNAPRTLDLDLLLFGDLALVHERLILPHPRLHERAFALRPLAELAPALVLPQGDWSQLLSRVADQAIERLDGVSEPGA